MKFKIATKINGFALMLIIMVLPAFAGVVNPDCTPDKMVKGQVTKAAVGVGNRCDVKQTATDTAKSTAGIEQKGPVEKATDNAKEAVGIDDKSGPIDKIKK